MRFSDIEGLAFGTSGVRGVVEAFDEAACGFFTRAFLELPDLGEASPEVVIGIDRRPSSPEIAERCCGMAKALGWSVRYVGVVPTPALALVCQSRRLPGIMVSGSHIPFDRNGLKFYRPDGEMTKADETAIKQASVDAGSASAGSGLTVAEGLARDEYLARYTAAVAGNELAGWRIGVYEHSSAGRDLYPEILSSLGATVVSLGRTEEFVPIDTEAVSDDDRALGRDWVQRYALDALLSTDGDGDRPLLADETGEWLRGDVLGMLAARELGADGVVAPVSCNTGIERSGWFAGVERTAIGSPHVIAGMASLAERFRRVVGFEANGGFMTRTPLEWRGGELVALPTRDAVLPALAVLVGAAARGESLRALVADAPARSTASDRLQDMPAATSQALLDRWQDEPSALLADLGLEGVEVSAVDTTDGHRATLSDGRIVHVRPSGNAPELRCYVEADTPDAAERLLGHCMEGLSRKRQASST